MIFPDTSIWVDHLRTGDPELIRLLQQQLVQVHPFVLGELAMGSIKNRLEVLALLATMPKVTVPTDAEVQLFVTEHRLFGRGIGYVDAHLLTSTYLTPNTSLWTRDKRLQEIARSMSLAYEAP